jgi:hypothetical protein
LHVKTPSTPSPETPPSPVTAVGKVDPAVASLEATVVERTANRLEAVGLKFAVPTNPKLERMGLDRFARHEARLPPLHDDEVVHILDAAERERIRRLSRQMVFIAFLVGAMSGLISSIASFLLAVPEDVVTTFWEDVRDFAIVNGVTIAATAVEVAILYRVALRQVHRMAREAGIRLVPRGNDPETDEQRAVALALARVALELPNPPQNAFGIDPYREISKWRLVVTTIIFKLKISITNFVLRLLIRRIGGRAIVKAWLTFTDVFVTGAWDALVAWRMIRQARVRVLGPSACESLLDAIVPPGQRLAPVLADAMLRAVAAVIVRGRDVHPNLLALMRAIARRAPDGTVESVVDIDDTALFLTRFDGLNTMDTDAVLEVLVLASFPDGSVSRSERELLATLNERRGRALDARALRQLSRRFADGRAVERSALRRVLRLPPMHHTTL